MLYRTYIDGNSVGHAAQHGHSKGGKKLSAGATETTAIFGMLTSMNKILRTRTTATPIVLWDGRSWRYNAFPDYKGNRTDTVEKQAERERYRVQRKNMFLGLHLLGVSQLVAGNMEADDLAAILTRKEIAKGNMVTLITGDKDWIQLVQHGVAWVDHKLDRKCTVSNFQEFTGYGTQKAFIHAKALQGDTGDNIKTNIGIGEKGALDLLRVFPCVHTFLRMPLDQAIATWEGATSTKLPKKFRSLHESQELRDKFEWALSLMDLGHPTIPTPEGIKGTKAKLDRPAFEAFCAQFAFMSIIKDMDRFLKPFITLEEEFNS
jgi:5'-3' exonuclease